VRNSTGALARVTLDRRTGAGFGRLVWLAQFHGNKWSWELAEGQVCDGVHDVEQQLDVMVR
jgi:hypothetical protein